MTRHKARQLDSPFTPNLRLAQGLARLTNEELARKADVSLRLLQKWRAGTSQPTGENLVKLAVALERDAEWFFRGHGVDEDGTPDTKDAA